LVLRVDLALAGQILSGSDRTPVGRSDPSKHGVLVGGCFRHDLQYIPVFDNFSILVQPKNVDARPIAVARPLLIAVENDVVALGDYSFEMHPLAGILPRHPLKVGDERLFAVGDTGIVLDVDIARIFFDGFRWPALIEHQIVERLAFALFSSSCWAMREPARLS
jgi:hypothetical protein